MRLKIKSALALVTFVIFSMNIYAQKKNKPKIQVEMSKEINGQKQTFKGEYNSEEEMLADPKYQEFAGSDEGMKMWMKKGNQSSFSFNIDSFNDLKNSFFKFDSDEDTPFSFDFFDGDSTKFSFNSDQIGTLSEKMKALGIEMERMAKQFGSQYNSYGEKVITVSEATEKDFGKSVRVAKGNELVLNDLQISQNSSSLRKKLKVRFKLPEEGELELKVANKAGKIVFSRFFERFGGFYSEQLNFSGLSQGEYLLEISLNDKKLFRKITLE